MASGSPLVGNRFALFGTILYLSEFLVFLFAFDLPTGEGGDESSIVRAYVERGSDLVLLAGLMGVVVLGRIVFVVALHSALRSSPRELALADVAIAAMTLSVAFEVVEYGLFGTAGVLAEANGNAGAIVALNGAGIVLSTLVLAQVGASVLASSIAMLRSGLFPRWLGWLGAVVGALLIAAGIVATAGSDASGTAADLISALTGPAFGVFILWMIATSVVLFRNAPPRGSPSAVPVEVPTSSS